MQKKRETLTKQQKFINKLVHLIKTVSRENAYRSAKIQKLKDLLADPDAFKYNFSKFDPIPLPLDPEVKPHALSATVGVTFQTISGDDHWDYS